LTKERKEKTKINKIKYEKGNIATDTNEIQKTYTPTNWEMKNYINFLISKTQQK
jgi:hypothetical protein